MHSCLLDTFNIKEEKSSHLCMVSLFIFKKKEGKNLGNCHYRYLIVLTFVFVFDATIRFLVIY